MGREKFKEVPPIGENPPTTPAGIPSASVAAGPPALPNPETDSCLNISLDLHSYYLICIDLGSGTSFPAPRECELAG